MPEHELFAIQRVAVNLLPEDLPGKPLRRVQCTLCSDWVQDKRDVIKDGSILCRKCAYGSYFIALPDM
jgi:formylmethanofuran dehydrogenase subunit E